MTVSYRMSTQVERGVLDLMVLRTLAATGPQHGCGLAQRLLQAADGFVERNQAAVYPALLRLEQRRWVTSRWGIADHAQTAKFYELTARGWQQAHAGGVFAGRAERVASLQRSAVVMLAATLWAHAPEDHTHVRTTLPEILVLVNEGRLRSDTFRRLVDVLDASDVIVYLEPKMTRPTLGGYLLHDVGGRGRWRYLRIAVDFHGAADRVIALLAHELQHAVEVAQTPGNVTATVWRRCSATWRCLVAAAARRATKYRRRGTSSTRSAMN